MHSFLVALAYMAMVFAPCAVAQWGDIFMQPYFGIEFLQNLFASSRRGSADPLLLMRQTYADAAEMDLLYSEAFTAPVPLAPFRRTAPLTFAEAINQKPQRAAALGKAAAQVAARLAQLVEAHRLVNAAVMEQEQLPAAAETFATPTFAELDALYAPEQTPAHAAVAVDTGTTMHLLPALAAADPSTRVHSPPIAVAA